MNFAKLAAATACVAVISIASIAAHAEDDASAAHVLATQCLAKNGVFDAETMQCAEPSEGTAAADPIMGPMLRGAASDTQDAQ